MSRPWTAEQFGISAPGLETWFATSAIAFDGPLEFQRIGLGQSNITLAVSDSGGRRWILRRPPLGHILDSAHDVLREAGVLEALANSNVPVPEIVGVCSEGTVSEAPLVLMEHVDGLVIDDLDAADRVTTTIRRGVSNSMAATMAAIHAVDLESTGLTNLASHSPYAQRQLKRWSRQWDSAKTRELPALDWLTDALRAAAPDPEELVLVHGDFHLRNVIVEPGSGSVNAVLDWELCTLGEPMADLGSLLAYWPEAGDEPGGVFAASALPGFSSRREMVDVYVSATGRDPSSLPFWHALGLWKIAIIVEGVLRRAIDEPANAAEGGPPDPTVVEILVNTAFDALGTGRH